MRGYLSSDETYLLLSVCVEGLPLVLSNHDLKLQRSLVHGVGTVVG